MEGFTAEHVAAALSRYLADEMTADELRAYLVACDTAISAGEADRALSGPVGAAALVLLEQDEGVRPPADVRSTLEAALRALSGAPAPRPRPQRNPIPRTKGARKPATAARGSATRQSQGKGKPPIKPTRRDRRGGR